MNIQLIQVPYDSGHRGIRTGRGPEHFLEHGLDRILRGAGHQVDVCCLDAQTLPTTEIATMFELNRLLAQQVSSAVRRQVFPLVLAGNCNSCLGTIAGIGSEPLGIVWLDAHGDLNTPETTSSGFLDGMGLAIAAGHCWRPLARTIAGFSPVPSANVLHIGGRDLDPAEETLLGQSGMLVVAPGTSEGSVLESVGSALDRLRERVARVYLHVDIDVLDCANAPPNRFAAPGGLAVGEVEEIIRLVRDQFQVCAAAITSYEPDLDRDDAVLAAGIRIARSFVA